MNLTRLIYVVWCVGVGCAVQRAPGGGPEDIVPPRVIRTLPSGDAVRVSPATVIICEFSERVNRLSVARALSIVPAFREDPKLRWKGATLTIHPPDSLLLNRTYVVTVGTDATDLRNNRMTAAHSWAFSTGDHVDRGTLSGRIYGDGDIVATRVVLYALADTTAPDPSRDPPLYQTQTDEDGIFQLDYLADGQYRLFAFLDRNRDLHYTASADPLALPPRDIRIREAVADAAGILLFLTVQDTLPPSARGMQEAGAHGLILRFNKTLHAERDIRPEDFTIHTEAGSVVDHAQWAITRVSDQPDYLMLFPDRPLSEGRYTMIIGGMAGLRGAPAPAAQDTVTFRIRAMDTDDPPVIAETQPAPDAGIVAPDVRIQLTFSAPMRFPDNPELVVLRDSLGVATPVDIQWNTPDQLTLTPRAWLRAGMRYTVTLDPADFRDLWGRPLVDSLAAWNFQVPAWDEPGTVSGSVSADNIPAGAVIVQLQNAATHRVVAVAKLPGPGVFHFNRVLPGKYRLQAIADRNGDGAWSPGSLVPYVPAEYFDLTTEPIVVRSGWDNTGQDLRLNP